VEPSGSEFKKQKRSPPMPATDEERFAEIYRDHVGILMKTTQAFVADRADRDDLFQEILIALWKALPQFDGRAKLSTYVYRVALSCALNWKRSRRRYWQRLDQYGTMLPEWPETGSARDRGRLDWLYARIHELPPVDRSLILLSLDRLSYGEIADVTGLSESNIGVRLHRIKQQLIAQSEEVKNEL
jgi:RNA polymerase sigma-70 factor, ECF subfamily